MVRLICHHLLFFGGWFLSKLLFKMTITGREHLPETGPLILISNHFSWFEAPLLVLYLPYSPAFVVATELQENLLFRLFVYAFDLIPIWRGQVDRTALRQASRRLEQGGVLGILPEGGIMPELQSALAAGHTLADLTVTQTARTSAQLIPARPGAAYLATRTQARILPVAFLGTEQVAGNLKRGRRTAVKMHIGPPFGPLTVDATLKGPAKRARLNELGTVMMQHIAALLPPENRGPYA